MDACKLYLLLGKMVTITVITYNTCSSTVVKDKDS